MPGLVGFTHDNAASAPETLRRMQDIITHEPTYRLSALFDDGKAAAAGSHSPFLPAPHSPVSRDGIHVWLHGEICNRDHMIRKADVEADDAAALLLALYQKQGDCSFVSDTDGDFCAVVYDTTCRKICLICDRLGLHPLYWTAHNGSLVWSSELKAFITVPGFSPSIDPLGVRQFLEVGYMLENRTWFEGVELVPTGTAITWDMRSKTAQAQRYWWWDQIRERADATDEAEIANELGQAFVEAVERRAGPEERVGVSLSGGLDSRAILAAMPVGNSPIHTVTAGQANCDDIRLAAKIAEVKGAHHHVVAIDETNWLKSRIPAVWWADGHDLHHMHMLAAKDIVRATYDIDVNGFAGGAIMGGAYLHAYAKALSGDRKKEAVAKYIGCRPDLLEDILGPYLHLRTLDYFMLQNRVRRLILGHTRYMRAVVAAQRMPFYDNRLVDLAYSLPDRLRLNSRMYNIMLMSRFPNYYEGIPWQKTYTPIGSCGVVWPIRGITKRLFGRIAKEARRIGIELVNTRMTYDYDRWLRHGPAISFLTNLFNDPSAVYPDFVPREKVIRDWEAHLKGQDRTRSICRYATLEVWLQQVLTGRYRPISGAAGLNPD